MAIHKTLLPLCAGLVFGATLASEAKAQSDPVLEYAAKFTCGRVSASDSAGGDADVVVGVYATSINIHNPQRFTRVLFNKKVVLAKPEGQPKATPVEKHDFLGPNQAEFVDCPLIYSLLSIEPPAHIEGFVVIEVVPEVRLGIAALPLDVVGKYSARPSTGEVSSLDVVVYSPMQISN